jgi:hypothetical protein
LTTRQNVASVSAAPVHHLMGDAFALTGHSSTLTDKRLTH